MNIFGERAMEYAIALRDAANEARAYLYIPYEIEVSSEEAANLCADYADKADQIIGNIYEVIEEARIALAYTKSNLENLYIDVMLPIDPESCDFAKAWNDAG